MRNLFLLIIISFIFTVFTGCATFISDTEVTPPAVEGFEKVGTVSADAEYWNWLFLRNPEERLAELTDLAEEEAAAEFGPDAVIRIENAEGSWDIKSLLMLFSAAGFVEDAYVEASVWKKLPEPDSLNYGYRYAVIPAAEYNGDWGFMQVEYRTHSELLAALDASLESGELKQSSYEYRVKKLPDTGKIFITLAREDITNAISRWFTFTCTHNGKTIFRQRGIEDIPYVYGTDKLWWNDMSYNVGPAWEGELKLEIYDSYRNEIFNFKVVKERYVIEE